MGNTSADTWDALVAGKSGITRVTQFDITPYSSQIGGEVKNFDPAVRIPRKEARRMARCSQLSVLAAYDAVEDSGLDIEALDKSRVGVVMGTGLGGMDQYNNMISESVRSGENRVKSKPLEAINGSAQYAGFPHQPDLRRAWPAEHDCDGLRGRHAGHRHRVRGDPPRLGRRDVRRRRRRR